MANFKRKPILLLRLNSHERRDVFWGQFSRIDPTLINSQNDSKQINRRQQLPLLSHNNNNNMSIKRGLVRIRGARHFVPTNLRKNNIANKNVIRLGRRRTTNDVRLNVTNGVYYAPSNRRKKNLSFTTSRLNKQLPMIGNRVT